MGGISADQVKELRSRTGAGIMDCKKALAESNGELEGAIDYLRKKGLSAAAKRSGRTTAEGLVSSYIHAGGKIGVLVEVNCETDFVARNEEFQTMVKDIAMHIAAARPLFIQREEVPQDFLDRERGIFREQAIGSGKPEKIVDKIVEGRLDKYYGEVCLMEQPFVKDTDITIKDLITRNIAKIGENIQIRRFARYELGEGIEKS
ncbi:MAG: elongation factor Ts [Nitrospirae bacterium CG_4_9_14_3_um_filter_53_35]|nr:MAG: elongation factor Ts [Nitrospirae bacterium CG2_30_53_67]PIS38367.1 MAG: elongation factor Ts [Nitrospirae bacterium CG08_land_8_20_14_0_20_52_24]PIV82634.1 MAG: elongation factor Ts [Nitrospirae bacterium CG17_big_fil_post_rev_8_21_14_2_50_50_9]PIW84328.1 MAG: elongation factor Ts [Nitrospirae bacterium CG_4_8_14_3_um_filter_50_41]PIX86015.1 MAG: elongation factor Ts [Nitrospirae bacterium CG_4_10_14_3_um_filter_53_41]PJA73069.1 MAG: elongation factor Ts [Nitrospirae bacterium CG_4_9_